ncbi:MAG: peptide chain release factor N(5)-glutamine methyltransferase [Vibrio sp.]
MQPELNALDHSDLTLEQALQISSSLLMAQQIETARLDAAVLLCHVLDKPRSYLLTWPEKTLTSEQVAGFKALLIRRLDGEPIAYILGEREFWSLALEVSPATLIPRSDTERLVELALDKAQLIDGPILDLGTGTGAIALALASEMPSRSVIGIDLMQEAQALATRNATKLNITNAQFLQGSWYQGLIQPTQFACIVSNPPYIDESDPHLAQGDVRFEPMSALVAADKGLADLRHIAKHGREHLLSHGWILLEHGYQQGADVRAILADYGYQNIETCQDYAGQDRVTLGQFKS